jgi:hypothetical protein
MSNPAPPLKVRCPCGATLALSSQASSAKTVTCPKCGQTLAVPPPRPAAAMPPGPAAAPQPAASGPRWYVALNKQKLGPFAAVQLRQMVTAGQLKPEDMVLPEGQGKWAPASSLPGLFPAGVAAARPPAPPAVATPRTTPAAAPVPAPTPAPAPAPRPGLRLPPWPWLAGAGAAVVVLVVAVVLFLSSGKPADQNGQPGGPPQAGQPEKEKGGPGGKAEDPDLAYVAPEFAAVAVLHPRRIAQNPLLAPAAREQLLAGAFPDPGAPPEKLERVLVLLAPRVEEKAEPGETPKGKGKEHTSPQGRFAARFPAPPKETSMKTKDGLDGSAVAEVTGTRYEVQYKDSDKAVLAVGPKFMLDAVADSFAKETKTKKAITLDGHPGLELTAEPAGGVVAMQMRLYMVKERLYMVMVTGPKATYDPARAKEFLDSFRLLGGKGTPDKGKGDDKGKTDEKAKTDDKAKADEKEKKVPPPPEPVLTAEEVRKKCREQLLAWCNANAAEGVADQIVKQYDKAVTLGKSYTLKLGTGLVKSGRPTLLAGQNGGLVASALAPEQAKPWVPARTMLFQQFTVRPAPVAVSPRVTLSSLRFNNADALEIEGDIRGSVTFKTLRPGAFRCSLRLTMLVKNATLTRYLEFDEGLSGNEGKLSFVYRADAPGEGHSGPTVCFLDVCIHPEPGQPERLVVLSNTVGALVQGVKPRPADEEEQEVSTAVQDGGPALGGLPLAAGVIFRFTEAADAKGVLGKLLKGTREAKFEGKAYLRSITEEYAGAKMAGCVLDERTVLLAPEPLLKKMLAARAGKSPLRDRLRAADPDAEATVICLPGAFQPLLAPLAGVPRDTLPPGLEEVGTLPDGLEALTASLRLKGDTLLRVALEASAKDAEAADKLAKPTLHWARKAPPPGAAGGPRLPPALARAVVGVADRLTGGVETGAKGKQTVLTWKRPDDLKDADPDLIASSGFNDARGMNRDAIPDSPFPLDASNKQGGTGEPGWDGLWAAHPSATFQRKVVFEGDGALYLKGSPNVGPNYGRRLAEAQTGRFQVEYRVQVPAGSVCSLQFWKDRHSIPEEAGPVCGVHQGRFYVHKVHTEFKCEPGRWYKVTLRIDVPNQTWEFFVDDKRYESAKPLTFRAKVPYLAHINFIVEGSAYIDALRVTRLPGKSASK